VGTVGRDSEWRVWDAWCEATGMVADVGPTWVSRFLVGSVGVTAWPIRLHPSMQWLKPPLWARRLQPETFDDLADLLAETAVPREAVVGQLIDPGWKVRLRSGGPLRTSYGPVLPIGTSVRFDSFQQDSCDGFDVLRATVLGTPIGDVPVESPVGRAGAAYLVSRLGIVDRDDPLASDHVRAEALHDSLIALLDEPPQT
jgi:hypothetical protein